MLELTLIRHASTRLNREGRYQGWVDEPLCEVGRREAECLARRLRGAEYDLVVCSDSRRSLETAALAIPDVPVGTDGRWRELHFGEWEGRSYAECLARDTTRLQAWIDDPFTGSLPGGEAMEGFCRRVEQALDALPRQGRALVIAHGGPIRWVVARALDLRWEQVRRFQISACGITRLVLHPGGAQLLTLNDTAHLHP